MTATASSPSPPGLVVTEPALPRRVRRPADLVRLVLVLLTLTSSVTLGVLAVGTAGALEQELIGASSGLPRVLLQLVSWVSAAGLLAVPVAVGVDLVVRGRRWQLLDALGAAGAGALVTVLAQRLVLDGHLGGLVQALTKPLSGQARTPPLDGLLVASVAFLTVADLAGRRALRPIAVLFVASTALTGFLSGSITALALLCSLLLGWSVGLAVRYGLGAASTRPPGTEVAAALRGCGVPVTSLELEQNHRGGNRRYRGAGADGPVEVRVFDRDTFGSATGRRILRRLQLRGPSTRGPSLTIRGVIEHHALMGLALEKLGVPSPRVVGACEVGPYAALVAFSPRPGGTLASMPPEAMDEGRLRALWRVLGILQAAKVAHRGLTAEHILLAPDGTAGLAEVGTGDIAAADLALRLDVAQLLTTVALVVGPERAVASARETLGAEPLVRALPLLQSVALSRETRQALRQDRQLLRALRAEVLKLAPDGEPVEQVEVRRVTPRNLVTVVGGAVAAYVLLTQLAQVDITQVLGRARWGWALAVVGFTALTVTGASLVITGAATTRLRFVRTCMTQLAVAFSGLVAPAAVGNVALNTRYLQRAGVEPGVAGGSVGLAQLAQFTSYFVLLVLSSVLAGTGPRASFTPPLAAVVGIIAVVATLLVLLALPAGRRLVSQRFVPMLQHVVPRVVSVLQHPRKVATLLLGALLLDLSFVAALTAATRAFGAEPPVAAVAVVYFAGAIVGSAVPTPGGLGGVEAALAAGLIAIGVDSGVAVSSVLLYRLATYWLPIPFGWVSLSYLQRVRAI